MQAKKVAFGEKNLASGPIIQEITREGNQLILTFDAIGNGLKLTEGDKVKGFVLEVSEGKFEVAEGQIQGTNQVIIPIPEGTNPLSIRYAWADNPEVNLVNEIGLPTQPFRLIIQ